MTTEQTGRLNVDTTGSLTPIDIDLETPLVASPSGGDPTPLPHARAADGTRKLKALPPPIPAVSRTKTPLPRPVRAKGTVPPPIPTAALMSDITPRALTADPDGWTVAPTSDDGLRDILAPDPEGPDVTMATPFVEPAATAPLDAAPSPEWLAKIDSVLRPETSAPIPVFTAPAPLPTTHAAAELFTMKADPPSLTEPLELVDLEPVVAQPLGLVNLHPVVTPAAVPVAPLATVVELPAVAAAVSLPAVESTGDFDVDFESDMTSAHTTNFEMPVKRRMISQRSAIGIFAGAAVLTVAYLATRGGSHPTPAPAAAPAAQSIAAPAPVDDKPAAVPAAQNIAAPAPATQEVAAPAATAVQPTMVRMPVTSKPSGALVTFVDGGKAVVVGRTPTTVAFDPRQPHDIALTLLDHETQLTTIPVGGMTALVVDMGGAKTGAPAEAHVATAVKAHDETSTTAFVTEPAPRAPAAHHTTAPKAAPAPKAPPMQKIAQPAPHMAAPAAVPAGAGVLMISSKPPCEIVVDGKSTHLLTPQRSIPLAAGNHTIMLVNAPSKIHKTVAITITAKKSTKVIQDFTKR